mmetsp:Transcript_12805/g.54243  ORF Transcript_12805/g.54243 Transcript_12805/m.54243 type:complete len:264 (+) Transcript_12805:550-1341(+)
MVVSRHSPKYESGVRASSLSSRRRRRRHARQPSTRRRRRRRRHPGEPRRRREASSGQRPPRARLLSLPFPERFLLRRGGRPNLAELRRAVALLDVVEQVVHAERRLGRGTLRLWLCLDPQPAAHDAAFGPALIFGWRRGHAGGLHLPPFLLRLVDHGGEIEYDPREPLGLLVQLDLGHVLAVVPSRAFKRSLRALDGALALVQSPLRAVVKLHQRLAKVPLGSRVRLVSARRRLARRPHRVDRPPRPPPRGNRRPGRRLRVRV